MPEPTRNSEFFDTLGRVLLWCWVIGFALLYVSLGVILLAGDLAYRMQAEMFDLSKHELNLVLYSSIVAIKLLVLVLFFIPWLAIRLALKGRKA